MIASCTDNIYNIRSLLRQLYRVDEKGMVHTERMHCLDKSYNTNKPHDLLNTITKHCQTISNILQQPHSSQTGSVTYDKLLVQKKEYTHLQQSFLIAKTCLEENLSTRSVGALTTNDQVRKWLKFISYGFEFIEEEENGGSYKFMIAPTEAQIGSEDYTFMMEVSCNHDNDICVNMTYMVGEDDWELGGDSECGIELKRLIQYGYIYELKRKIYDLTNYFTSIVKEIKKPSGRKLHAIKEAAQQSLIEYADMYNNNLKKNNRQNNQYYKVYQLCEGPSFEFLFHPFLLCSTKPGHHNMTFCGIDIVSECDIRLLYNITPSIIMTFNTADVLDSWCRVSDNMSDCNDDNYNDICSGMYKEKSISVYNCNTFTFRFNKNNNQNNQKQIMQNKQYAIVSALSMNANLLLTDKNAHEFLPKIINLLQRQSLMEYLIKSMFSNIVVDSYVMDVAHIGHKRFNIRAVAYPVYTIALSNENNNEFAIFCVSSDGYITCDVTCYSYLNKYAETVLNQCHSVPLCLYYIFKAIQQS